MTQIPTRLRRRFARALSLFLLATPFISAAPPLQPRNLLAGPPEAHQLGKDVPGIQAALVAPGDWQPYPVASDRAAWEAIPADLRAGWITAAETEIGKAWSALRATDFLAYKRDGKREPFQIERAERRRRLLKLVIAECMEGQGRFLDSIADGIWATCEETYWGVSAHVFMQRAGNDLPDASEPTVDLFAAETASMLSWVSYLMGPQLDTVSPMLVKRIRYECERRVLEPCFERADFWWMGWDTQGHPINNWNPWIVSNWISTALLLEENPERRARHVEKAQRVMDIFINSYPEDGGCDEGPGYWGRAGASMFDALQWMHSASEGRISIFDEPLVHKMGRYIMSAHVVDDWYVNFADARAKFSPDGALIYNYGQAVDDPELSAFGVWVWQNTDYEPAQEISMGRVLPQLFLARKLNGLQAAAPLLRDVWLPDLQFMVARDAGGTSDGLYLVAKGGHNDESHNHNDVGSFITYLDGEPLLIDAGPEAYNARTFSAERYEIWTMRSGWHNVPLINGAEEAAGRHHAASALSYEANDERAIFGLELAGAYPESAGITSWRREFDLERGEALRISDTYQLTAPSQPSELHYLTHRPVDVSQAGTVRIGAAPGAPAARTAVLNYDASRLRAEVESREVTDTRLRAMWGPEVHLIKLIEREVSATGAHTVEIRPAVAAPR
ncbi:heparinase II/III domain-containing protein [Actomonas aquatica]|uniref:Heparinase II/III family protein n=1 Tax=Actomonas aquatica TaxID=2866162 RepID=A0ABZ1C2S0_9BACT|nr:heparinase II/III family protein [Opitutus sp. WL0086]WRQ86008.1 heparinase II/III family protein [Opitutus sp. WL0086]